MSPHALTNYFHCFSQIFLLLFIIDKIFYLHLPWSVSYYHILFTVLFLSGVIFLFVVFLSRVKMKNLIRNIIISFFLLFYPLLAFSQFKSMEEALPYHTSNDRIIKHFAYTLKYDEIFKQSRFYYAQSIVKILFAK